MFVGFIGEYAHGKKYTEFLPEGWKGDNLKSAWNHLRLSVADGEAKLYINDVFLDKVTPNNPDASYTNLVIDGIRNVDGITGVGVKGAEATPPSNSGDFDSGKQAGIQQCVNDPASCGITVSAGDSGTSTGGDFDSGKQAGIQQCVADPASCGITVSAGNSGTSTGGAHATYSPATGEVHIPFIDVPGPFGGIQTYEVYLIQQPLTFAFDLDMNRINMR
jgi:hypothetical protein